MKSNTLMISMAVKTEPGDNTVMSPFTWDVMKREVTLVKMVNSSGIKHGNIWDTVLVVFFYMIMEKSYIMGFDHSKLCKDVLMHKSQMNHCKMYKYHHLYIFK